MITSVDIFLTTNFILMYQILISLIFIANWTVAIKFCLNFGVSTVDEFFYFSSNEVIKVMVIQEIAWV